MQEQSHETFTPIHSPQQPTKPPQKSPNRRSPLLRIFPRFILLLLVLSIPLYAEWIGYLIAKGQVRATRDSLSEFNPTSFAGTSRFVADAIARSVVHISISGEGGGYHGQSAGQGSGIIVDSEGCI